MTVGDWGQSLLYANKLGSKDYTLVDLGHHLPNAKCALKALSFLLKLASFKDFPQKVWPYIEKLWKRKLLATNS
jgi:L-rhamnose isomerase